MFEQLTQYNDIGLLILRLAVLIKAKKNWKKEFSTTKKIHGKEKANS